MLLFSQTYFSTSIGTGDVSRATFTELHITMSDVPVKYLDCLENKVRENLRSIIRKGIDMKRLHAIMDWYQKMVGSAFSTDILF